MSDDESSTARTIRLIKAEGFAAGYDKAVANLLDRDKFATYRQQQGHPDANLTETQRRAAVAYLEAVQEQP